jgi:quercetin dioxygenase-like cupin family protein
LTIYVTGIDDNGSSCITSKMNSEGPIPVTSPLTVYTGPSLPELPASPGGGELMANIAPPSGSARWTLVDFAPGTHYPLHYTTSIDVSTVLDGTIEFGVDTENVQLAAGDTVVVNGVSHSWYAPNGCRLLVSMLGSE